MYIGSITKQQNKKYKRYLQKTAITKNQNHPQLRLSKNSNTVKFSISNEAWDHSKMDLMKYSFNLWPESSSLKILYLHTRAYTEEEISHWN